MWREKVKTELGRERKEVGRGSRGGIEGEGEQESRELLI